MTSDDSHSVETDTALACLVMLARYYRQPLDPDQVRHELGLVGRALGVEDVVRAARRKGFKSKELKSSLARLDRLALPAIAELKDGAFCILAKVSEDKVLLQDPRDPGPKTIDRTAFADLWTGRLAMIVTRAGVTMDAGRKFDVSWFVPAIVKYRKLFGEVFIASFFLQIFALVTPLFFQLVIDKVLVHRGLTTLDVLVFGLIAVSLFEVVLGTLRTYVFSHTASRVDVVLGASLFKHLMALPISYFESRPTGQTVARVRELETIRAFLTGSALTLVLDVFFTVVFLAVMWFYSQTLTLIVLASIPAYVLLSILITPTLRARVNERFNRGAANQTFLVESVVGAETIKAMAVEPQLQRRWEDLLAGYVRASFRATNLNNIAGQIAQFVNKAVVALTLWFGARLVIEGDLTVGQLVAFNMLAGRVSAPVLRLAQLWQDFQEARISIDRLGDILNAPTETTGGSARGALPAIEGRITFDHVTFRYAPDKPEVLKDVTLDIRPGDVVGVVGPSGSGKSTLTKLVQRLHVPLSGRVLIDGVDLAMVDPAWLRRQVGVVLQENVLFNRSVRDNIAFSDPGMAMERVVEAAKLAGAHDFILELSHGYDTVLEERGSNLSGGQRQRIAIARALVSDPRILIFDEATSALDYESEYEIQRNMRRITQGRTVIIIAHRLAAVRDANRIITIERGRVVEDGSHESLLAQGGRYATLYHHQTAGLRPTEVAESA